MGASQSQAEEDDKHGHAHADGSIHHGHSHGGRSSGLVPAPLTAAQLQSAPTVAPTSQYLSSTHAPVTLAAPSATPVKPAVTSGAVAVAPTGGATTQVTQPTLGSVTSTTSTTTTAVGQPQTEPVGHHPQAVPTGVVKSTSTTTTQQPVPASKTAVAGAAVTQHEQQQQHQPSRQQAVQTSSSSSYGAVPVGGQVSAPVSNITVVPTSGHAHSQTTAAHASGAGVATREVVVRPIEFQQAAVQPGFASEAAAGKAVTSQPAVHAGPSADRATLAPSAAVVGSSTHIAPVSTGQAVAPPTLYQTVAPGGQVTAASQPAPTTQSGVARASAATAITAGTVSSSTTSTATTAPTAATTAPATTITTAGATGAASKSQEPGSPDRPAKVAKGMQNGLWSRLITWCNPLLPQGVVLAWDERDVANMVLALPHSADFKATLQQRQLERKKRRKQQALEQADAAAKGIKLPLSSPTAAGTPVITSPHSSTQLPVPYELASVLLSLDKTLSAMRLQWVPSRVSEDTFFVEYFGAIVSAINAHVTRVETELTGKAAGGPTVHDRVNVIEDRAKA